MDEIETTKVLAYLKVSYPASVKDLSKQAAEAMITLWQEMFSDKPVEIIMVAVKAHISLSRFFPTIAEIKDYIQKLTEPEQMGSAQAWRIIKQALNGPDVHYTERGWDYTLAFNKLPVEVQSIVGNPSQMRIWGDTDEQQLENFTQRDFIKGFEARQRATNEFNKLPSSVKSQSAQLKEIPLDRLLKIAEGKQL